MRSTVRLVKTLFGNEAIVADWRYQLHPADYKIESIVASRLASRMPPMTSLMSHT